MPPSTSLTEVALMRDDYVRVNAVPLLFLNTQNSSENRQKIEIFKERFLPIIILWSLSTWSQFKAQDLCFLKVLTECKSKLYFHVNYSLLKATYCADCRGWSCLCLFYFSACTIVSNSAKKWIVQRAFSTVNNHLIFKHLVLI